MTVDDLATRFAVSRATIRRDLNQLESAALLERTYGGAVKPPRRSSEDPFSERKVRHYEEKNRIDEAAARLVRPNEMIFLDGGTTTECITDHLKDTPGLTVVTFGLNILTHLAGQADITLIAWGGTLDHGSLTFGGVLGVDFIDTYGMRFDKSFIAAGGVSAEYGITNASFEEIPVKRKAIEASTEAILVADSSKLGLHAAGLIVPAARIDRLITNRGAPESEIAGLRRLGVTTDLV